MQKKTKKQKKAASGGLTNSCENKRSEKAEEKRKDIPRYTHLNAEFQRIGKRDKKAFLSDQCKEREKIIKWERQEISSRK